MITRPATSGTCDVVGCDNGADFESQIRSGDVWRVSLSCAHHARPFEIAALMAEMDA